MPRTKKPKENPTPPVTPQPAIGNGALGDVLTLAEAAAYLRLPEAEVVGLVHSQDLPGRFTGREWRFLKSAIQEWLSKPPPKYSKEAQMSVAGLLKDDPDLIPMVEEIYRQRGRPITEDGSYNLLHGLEPGSEKK
ncbi:MAG TPA: helix-turn-helix domain-containing protein [Gemmataceae bacterium]|nr:helix-turn-helix domain-containing protein [Gemmataceae bacterium]